MGWWYDPDTGTVAVGEIGGQPFGESGDPIEDDDHEFVAIDAAGSHEGYQDMVDFAEAVGDRTISDALHRALEGRGAFRRFRDALYDHEELSRSWRSYAEACSEVRAIRWLSGGGFVAVVDADLASVARRRLMADALAAASAQRNVELADTTVADRWPEVVQAIDEARNVMILRDGEPWATVIPAPRDART